MPLTLLGIDFKTAVFNASCTRNYFPTGKVGNGWRQHWPFRFIPGYSWDGAGFTARTVTLDGRVGNLELRPDLQPARLFPGCIYIDWWQAVVLNNVGLSGPKAKEILDYGIWQNLTRPFLLSFMAVAPTPDERLREAIEFCQLLKTRLSEFKARFALVDNGSCPNASHDPGQLVTEAGKVLQAIVQILPNVPLLWKINALASPQEALEIVRAGWCEGIIVSNTIPFRQNAIWAQEPSSIIDWDALFGRGKISPLKRRGYDSGGLSGWPLLPLVDEWVRTARRLGMTIPIIAGGGIQRARDIDRLRTAGVNAIKLGTVALLRPWRLQRLIRYGNAIL